MLTIFSDLGTEVAYKKFLSADKPHKQDIAGYIFLKLSLLILFCLIACIAYVLFYQYPSIDKALIFIAFSITLIELSSQFFSNTLSGCRDFVYLSKIEVSASILLFIYNVIICLLFPNIYLLALNMGILPLCLIIAGSYYCIQRKLFFFERPKKTVLIKYFRYSYPILTSSIIGVFISHFEKVILGRLIGMKELGFYRLALGIFSGFDMIIKPITNTLFTELSYRVNQSVDFMKKKFCDLIQTLNMMGAILILFLLFFSKPIVMTFYGSENIRTAVILQFFSLAIISRLFWRPYRHILYAVEAHHPLAYLSVIDLALRLGLYYLLIPLTFKGFFIGAAAIPVIEFILWILPSGVYNLIALIKRFENIHIIGVLSKVWLPLLIFSCVAFLFNFSLYVFPLLFILFLVMEYYLGIITIERWNNIILPVRDLFHYSKG